jgi:hypothetical protein
LYGGPETVEHVFEREDSFQAHHSRRREGAACPAAAARSSQRAWYRYRYIPETGEVEYILAREDE